MGDEDLQEALTQCGLEALTQQLDREADWTRILSLADRQRLSFTLLLVMLPAGVQWLLLDDADGALDGETAFALHEQLVSRTPGSAGIIVVSRHPEVVHRPGWRQFHIDPERCTL